MTQTATGHEIDHRSGPELLFVSDPEAITAVLDNVPNEKLDAVNVTCHDVTALLVAVHEGGYQELWAAETARPYDLNATYTRIF